MKTSTALATLIGPKTRKKLPTALADISRLSVDQMIDRGVSQREALRISAAVSLAREISEPSSEYEDKITGPGSAIAFCLRRFRALACHGVQEEFWIVTLDTKNRPIACHQITIGTLRSSLVHPREVFRPAIADAANCFIAVHNHPSGDCTPSDQDFAVTDRLDQVADIVGIPMIDHIVIGGDSGISIKEHRGR